MPCFHNHNYSLFALKMTTRMWQQAAFFFKIFRGSIPSPPPPPPNFDYGLTTLKLLPLALKSTVEEWLEMTLITLSTAMPDLPQDKWTTLPPLPATVKWFGLGQVNGKPVAVGGAKGNHILLNNAYTSVLNPWHIHLPCDMLCHVHQGFSLRLLTSPDVVEKDWIQTSSSTVSLSLGKQNGDIFWL